ncbi:MAG: tetratricopeptide repeat protein [Promethearchaeota archaeon]
MDTEIINPLYNVAKIHEYLFDYDKALECYQKAHPITRKLGD